MKRDYKSLLEQSYQLYLREIDEDDFRYFFSDWAQENDFKMPKRIRFLENMAYNSSGETVPIVQETEKEVYYNDGCHRYCYLLKSEIGRLWEWANDTNGVENSD